MDNKETQVWRDPLDPLEGLEPRDPREHTAVRETVVPREMLDQL